MIFHETSLSGAFIIDLEPRTDTRGFFARTFDAQEFEARGMRGLVAQCNVSYNPVRGTMRGMHMQLPPATEPKLVRCTRGAVHDVIVDMRPASPTYLRHLAVELTADNRRQLYVPDMFAHGYLTLTDHAEVAYQVGEYYSPGHERGLRHDDPALGIEWPAPVTVISPKDAAWPLLVASGSESDSMSPP